MADRSSAPSALRHCSAVADFRSSCGPDAVGQLTGGPFREGDGGDAVGGDAGGDQGHEALDEARRLPGPGPRFEEDRLVELLANSDPRRGVSGRHRMASGSHIRT